MKQRRPTGWLLWAGVWTEVIIPVSLNTSPFQLNPGRTGSFQRCSPQIAQYGGGGKSEWVSEWESEREWERERDPFEGSWGTNKLCLAQMGEKGRADCHLSGTLKCQSITPELLIVCSSKLLCENSANRLFGERAISQWKSKALFINAKNVTCHVEHTVGSEHVKSDFVMSPAVKLLFECKYFMREA